MSVREQAASTEHAARERLRRSFRPAALRILFVGESPPASGKFFYRRDSGLYRAMRAAFQAADPSIDEEHFLETFRACGCYLVDLCPEPVDKLERAMRAAMCRESEALLANTIRRLQPETIATLVRSIEGNVARSIARTVWHGRVIQLPYPGRWARHRSAFAGEVAPLVRELLTHSLAAPR